MNIDSKLKEVIDRAVEAATPLKIILFGSAARDNMSKNSDLDLLVVVPDGSHRREIAHKIYRSLFGAGVGFLMS